MKPHRIVPRFRRRHRTRGGATASGPAREQDRLDQRFRRV
ncbi:MAG: hypothetical protein JWQ72_3149, partial [Polaromonas sp.]|nr:hypothetical protein [Polaromonas sp.]